MTNIRTSRIAAMAVIALAGVPVATASPNGTAVLTRHQVTPELTPYWSKGRSRAQWKNETNRRGRKR